MLTNFQNSFTGRLTGKFATNSYLNIPPRLTNRLTFGEVMGKSLVSCFFETVYIFKLKNERMTLPTHTINHVQQICIATFLKINTCNEITGLQGRSQDFKLWVENSGRVKPGSKGRKWDWVLLEGQRAPPHQLCLLYTSPSPRD